jgi:3-oxoacyl-[acyl-carrier protein] reductase
MHVDLEGRVFIVTGASGAIGSAIARRLAAGGATLGLCDMEAPRALQDELGPRASAAAIDVRSPKSVRSLVSDCVGRFGKLDGIVTVAGVTSLGAFETIEPAEWDRVHDVNLKGVFLCCQAAIASLKANKFGRIVNIGSVLAKNGGNPRPWLDASEQARAGNAAYGAAKAGVHALTLYLAKELASCGITANVVAPGPVRSGMTATFPKALADQIPVGRLGLPDEVSAAVAFLCSDEASFINGEILDVNGGLWVD